MPSYEESQIIAAGLAADLTGLTLVVSTITTPVAVYPQANSGVAVIATSQTLPLSHRASVVIVRTRSWSNAAAADIHVRADQAAVAADPSARLIADTEYVLPLGPGVNTLHFISESAGALAYLRWAIRP